MLEYIILGFLMHTDMSGYDIKRFMELSTAYFYDASFGSIYPMLRKMEENGKIASRETVDGGKYKKVYSLTEAGRAEFFQWLEQPIQFRRASLDHLVNVFFYGFLPKEKARALIEEFAGRMEAELAALETLEKTLGDHPNRFGASTLDYGKGFYRYTADWCRRLLDGLPDRDAQSDCCKE